MNILYDISVMGNNWDNSASKAGIPRVVESLAYQLLERPDCHLELCSSVSLTGSLEYVQTDPRLESVAFPHHKRGASFQRRCRDMQSTVDSAAGLSRVRARAARKLLHLVGKYVKSTSETLQAESLRNADIYHSTFYPLPKQAKVKDLQRFLTLYDLIPVLHPEVYGKEMESMGQWFQTILSSIDKETWIVCISEATKGDLCEHIAIDPSRVFVTPLAADPTLFYPVTDADELTRVQHHYHVKPAPYVLSLCTIEPRKNIDHAIRCYVRLMQEGKTPDLQLVLAGSKGWNYDHIFRQIEGAEAFQANIVVTGFVANEDLAALYSGALAFVFPSLYEGFGLPPLEAMQCGVPVIVSNTSSLPEVVGEAGIMLDPKDADGLCQSLLSLYEDSSLRAELAKKSLLQAAGFSWQRCAEDTVNAYKTALS